jgi:hypothetical protein
MAHLSDDETVAKMGHPDLRKVGFRLGAVSHARMGTAIVLYGQDMGHLACNTFLEQG